MTFTSELPGQLKTFNTIQPLHSDQQAVNCWVHLQLGQSGELLRNWATNYNLQRIACTLAGRPSTGCTRYWVSQASCTLNSAPPS